MSSNASNGESSKIRSTLERKSRDELSILAKKLAIVGLSRLNKSELVCAIKSSDSHKLNRLLFPTWWSKHHNHVYGVATVVGVVLTIAFFLWPSTEDSRPGAQKEFGRSSRIVMSIETPIRFADFAALPPSERTALLDRYRGTPTVWEGFLSETIGFEAGSLEGAPTDAPVGVRITPTRGALPQITADCQLGILGGGDAGLENAMRLNLLAIGQRVRISGEL